MTYKMIQEVYSVDFNKPNWNHEQLFSIFVWSLCEKVSMCLQYR